MDKNTLPSLESIEAENCQYEEAQPNFEDGFIHILGGSFDGVSALANQMKETTVIEGNLIEATEPYTHFC